MAGLLDFFGNMDKRTQMGLLMAGAQMMNTPRQQGGLGAVGNGLLGFAQGLIDQERQDKEDARLERTDARQSRLDDVDMQLKQAQAQRYLTDGTKQPDPYYTPIPTANGVYGFDNRSGKVQLAIDENGQPVIKSSDSIPLQSGLAGAKKAAENSNSFVELDNADGSKSKMLGGAAFPELLQRPMDLSGLPQKNSTAIADSLLNGLIKTESSGNPNAVSPKGAIGLTQIMPETGRNPGYGVKPLQNNSPEENMRFGRDYLAAMIKANGGDVQKALSAYNQGQGNLQKNGVINQGYVDSVLKNSGQVDITNPITKPAVAGMHLAAKNGVSPIEAIDKGVAIAEQSVNDLKQVQSAANTIYKGQSTEKKLALETDAKNTQDQNKANIELDLEGRKKQQEKAAQLPDTMADFDNLEKTVNEIENHPGLSKGVGFIGKFARGFDGFAPHDFAVKAKQFGDQAFLAQIPKMKGFGQLTEAEGARLVSSLSTLGDPTQSEEQYRKEIGSVRNWLKLARDRASSRAGVEQPQVSHIDNLLDKYK
jgi:hypothetical protein